MPDSPRREQPVSDLPGASVAPAIDRFPGVGPSCLTVLVVDDDPELSGSVEGLLLAAGHRVAVAGDGAEAAALMDGQHFDVAVIDVGLPKIDGLTLFRRMHRQRPATAVILMTGHGVIPDAVAALREGAFDYIVKPFDGRTLLAVVESVSERLTLRRALEQAREDSRCRPIGDGIIGGTAAMTSLGARIRALAKLDAPVLVTGESGSGKNIVARAIHNLGPRRNGPFVVVNCTALAGPSFEAGLFGSEADPSRGVQLARGGCLETARSGTLVLNEIGAIALTTQSRVMHSLQGRSTGATPDDHAMGDVRLIATTQSNLGTLVAVGRFREDLFGCLIESQISIPPLRERRGDLVALLAHFLKQFTPKGHVPPGVSPGAWAALAEYGYPGNVREFAHAIERGVAMSRGNEVGLEHLPPDIVGGRSDSLRPIYS